MSELPDRARRMLLLTERKKERKREHEVALYGYQHVIRERRQENRKGPCHQILSRNADG